MTEQVNTQAVREEFTMDPGLLVSVIKSQAGTLTKALLEGIMNSLDAGAPRVDVTLTTTGFVIEDTGRGFTSEEEIRSWFGRFGTPHKEGDATYGRFRMGRGQMMSYAATVWKSNDFCMTVDIEKNGLTYDLSRLEEPFKGCRIEGTLYKVLQDWKLNETLTELRKFVAYTPKPVYVNGELYGATPARLKTWTHEDENAYYKVVPGTEEMLVYNQGVFVESMGTWRTGGGGVVVSKKALQVNFARNAVQEDDCPVWAGIKQVLQKCVLDKLSSAKNLSEGERKYLARRCAGSRGEQLELLLKAKVLTDPSGKHLPLQSLRGYSRFAYVEEGGALACSLHGVDRTFVVTEKLLTRFGYHDVEEFVDQMRRIPGLIAYGVEILHPKDIHKSGLGGIETLKLDALSAKQAAAFAALKWLNERIAQQLMNAGRVDAPRELLLGRHKKNTFVAWTDGKTYITANRGFLKMFDKGLNGVLEWAMTLVHEYTHDTDDSESHAHGEVFYQKFHDTVFSSSVLNMGELTQAGLVEYLNQLKVQGQSRPRELVNQLRPAIELRSNGEKAAAQPTGEEPEPEPTTLQTVTVVLDGANGTPEQDRCTAMCL